MLNPIFFSHAGSVTFSGHIPLPVPFMGWHRLLVWPSPPLKAMMQGWPLTPLEDPTSSSSGPAHAFTPVHRQVRKVARNSNLPQWILCSGGKIHYGPVQLEAEIFMCSRTQLEKLEKWGDLWDFSQKTEKRQTFAPKYSSFFSCAHIQSTESHTPPSATSSADLWGCLDGDQVV